MYLFRNDQKNFVPLKKAQFSTENDKNIEDIQVFSQGVFCTGCNDGKLKFWSFNCSFLKEFDI